MQDTNQITNPTAKRKNLDRHSLWLGLTGILLFVLGRIIVNLSFYMPGGYIGISFEAFITALSITCGLLAIIMGRIANFQNKTEGLPRSGITAKLGILFGVLTFLPIGCMICGMFLLGLATNPY